MSDLFGWGVVLLQQDQNPDRSNWFRDFIVVAGGGNRAFSWIRSVFKLIWADAKFCLVLNLPSESLCIDRRMVQEGLAATRLMVSGCGFWLFGVM